MSDKFLENTTLITYSSSQVSAAPCNDIVKRKYYSAKSDEEHYYLAIVNNIEVADHHTYFFKVELTHYCQLCVNF
ncbi:hypothetical protein [Psychrobacter aquaticus]|uniref:Uncharacterized protein n=1 Tax=Psychrobacter aquaticus CMS 56 TaxID=1354303 RepID=U4T331_9GAMM|nr:hypothetical protein [Psychrobacter aquaticus]ERL54386.1 hypothetical protein M917_2534 [Psychrobacter aquaticus CMS 56]